MRTEETENQCYDMLYKVYLAFKMTFRLCFVIVNNLYCIPTFCVWILILLPFRKLYPPLYWKIEGIFFHWLISCVSSWSWSAGYHIVEVGDDISPCLGDRTLVVVNHQSTGDVPMLMANFNARRDVLPNIMWIMDYVFKFTNFGIVSTVHQDFFILSGKSQRDLGVKLLREHLRKAYIPRKRKLMILFPEGGFLRKRIEASQRFAEKNNLPRLNNVTLPRMGAFQAIIEELSTPKPAKYGLSSDSNGVVEMKNGDKLNWILDITLAYPEGIPLDIGMITMGYRKPCKTYMCYRLYPLSQVPKDPSEMQKWLTERWAEKDKMLQHFYETGEFDCKDYCNRPQQPQIVRQSPLRFFLLHVFWIVSTYFHYKCIGYLFTLL